MSATEPNPDKLVADLLRIVHDSEELLHAAKDAAGDTTHEVRQRLTDALETLKRNCRCLEDKALEGAKAADRTVRDPPSQSISDAFGSGCSSACS